MTVFHLPRTLDEAIAAEEAGHPLRYLYFWGHQPARNGEINQSCLSQWWPVEFTDNGHAFASAEHYMMTHKAWLFDDEETAERVLTARHPGEAKALGREVRDFDEAVWAAHRRTIVVRGNIAKFGQHPALKEYLFGTRHRVLVEASPKDRVWGIGLTASDPRAASPSTWLGTNLLGFALMEARGHLLSVDAC
ncbi:hypothetical protein SAMN05421505_115118 [Sinosporangium album]|uniref:NADAR domain-containing protein n=1 Tax=Sinosporangium album TaxID=504805 RepID=A0A1G8CAW4_9ACTN|nr:hypothetical protein SAMN05421505_115118 [Sinosporangium album]